MSGSEFLTIYKNLFPLMKRHLDMLTLRHWDKKISSSKNILNKSGMKFYSQNDEDGILMEILRRINIKNISLRNCILFYKILTIFTYGF